MSPVNLSRWVRNHRDSGKIQVSLQISEINDHTRLMEVASNFQKTSGALDLNSRELFNRDMAGETARLMLIAERAGKVDLEDRIVLMEMEAPSEFVGKTLKSLHLRRKYDVQVVLVRWVL